MLPEPRNELGNPPPGQVFRQEILMQPCLWLALFLGPWISLGLQAPTLPDSNVLKVAIIGAGVGGSTTAYFAREELGPLAELHV